MYKKDVANVSECEDLFMSDNYSTEIVIPHEGNADSSQTEAAAGLLPSRPVTPLILHALGLMKIRAQETIAESVPLFKSHRTDTHKNAGGSHTSASQKRKSKSASSTAKKTFSVKKEHVSEPKRRAKKRSHATLFNDECPSLPVVVEKTREPAAPATDEPTTKEKPRGMKKQQHEPSPPVTKISFTECKSTVETAANSSELSSAVDDDRLWCEISRSHFKSMEYHTLLKNNQFTNEQIDALQKWFQYLSRNFSSGPMSFECSMKTHQCMDCDFSISHECTSINSAEYWPFHGIAPCIEYITAESTVMCVCNFAFFHSHKKHVRPKSKPVMPRPLPNTFHWVPNLHSVNLDCSKCYMKISMTNDDSANCFELKNFFSSDGPGRKPFIKYVNSNLNFAPKRQPFLTEFHACSSHCCMVFHYCEKNVFGGKCIPLQNRRPLVGWH